MTILAWMAALGPLLLLLFYMSGTMTGWFKDWSGLTPLVCFLAGVVLLFGVIAAMTWGIGYLKHPPGSQSQPPTSGRYGRYLHVGDVMLIDGQVASVSAIRGSCVITYTFFDATNGVER